MADGSVEFEHTLSGAGLLRVLRQYREMLEVRRSQINAINVFPVADADTGTNLLQTVTAVVAALDTSEDHLESAAASIVAASPMAGRGVSGLIMSQALGGFCSVLAGGEEAGGRMLAAALGAASRSARESVVDPVEGTMLTAAERAAHAAEAAAGRGSAASDVARSARDAGWQAVAESPRFLPVLAAAGVVDSGAVGYALFLDVLAAELDFAPPPERELPGGARRLRPENFADRYEVVAEIEEIGGTTDRARLRSALGGLGSSAAVSERDGAAYVHVHTGDPGGVLDVLGKSGTVRRVETTDLVRQVGEAAGSILVVVPDVESARRLLETAADRVLAPPDAAYLLQAVQSAATHRVRIVAVGDVADSVRSVAALSGVEIVVVDVRSVEEAVEILGRTAD